MLNRNQFIDDVIVAFNELIVKLEVDEKCYPRVKSAEVSYPQSQYLKDRIQFILEDERSPESEFWGKPKNITKTQFLLELLHNTGPHDEGGFSVREIEALLQKHEKIVSTFCPANYEGLSEFCNMSINQEKKQELVV